MGILDERKVKRIEVGIPSDISARDEETLYIGATEDSGIALGSTTVVPSNSNNDQRTISIDAFAKQLSSIEGKYDAVEGKYNNFNASITSQINSVNSNLSNINNYLGNTGSPLFYVKTANLTDELSGKLIEAGNTQSYTTNIYTKTNTEKNDWIALGVVGWYIYNSNTLLLQRCYLDNGTLKFSFSNKSGSNFKFSTTYNPLFTTRILFVKRRIIPGFTDKEF